MSGRPTKTHGNIQEDNKKRAFGIISDIRNSLLRRLAEYVLDNEGRIRSETMGEDSYSFCLQQMEEFYLNKLTIVERTVAELSRSDSREGQPMATTYEAVELVAPREELPQRVADALAEHGLSDFLDLVPLKIDDKQAEVLLVMAREESGIPLSITTDQDPAECLEEDEGKKGEDSDHDDAT